MIIKIKEKLIDSLFSVLPIYFLIILLNFTPLLNFSSFHLLILSISTFFLVIGMSLFSLGADLAMMPMGKSIGTSLTKQGNIKILILICFLFGLFVTIAEPDLTVLANQTKSIFNPLLLIVFVGLGVGLFLTLAVLKIIFKQNLGKMLTYFYMVLFALCIFVILKGNEDMLALAFDSGGVTTGPITVPFLMALGVGISSILSKKSEKDASFGFVAMCSVGPIIAVLILVIFANNSLSYSLPNYNFSDNYFLSLFFEFLICLKDVGIPLLLIFSFFMIIDVIYLKLPKERMTTLIIGIIYAYLGLSIFLLGVTTGFLPIGYKIGVEIASYSKYSLIPFSLVIGALTVLAEPAIHVLNRQVEEITGGLVKKKYLLISLTIGAGLSLALSMIRIIFDFSILYYLIPGYLLCLGLSFFVPKIYSAIAFDSGGVSSGPLTSSFILPMAIGACVTIFDESKVLLNGFGIVSMVAMTPIITINLLGLYSIIKDKIRTKNIVRDIIDSDDGMIIEFM